MSDAGVLEHIRIALKNTCKNTHIFKTPQIEYLMKTIQSTHENR